ncbi:MAG TPA: DUF2846 domain-containing protein [Thermoanaerobaculia bacterium]|nr:DUF2846 domain-containing protein [Thermoanaerobaculia bacterium]
MTLLPLGAQDSNAARIYVIDDMSGIYGALPYNVLIDGRKVCTLAGEQFSVVDLEPGRHRVLLEGNATAQDFDLPAGTVTYLRLDITKLREDAKLSSMDAAAAQKAMAASTLVETLLPGR